MILGFVILGFSVVIISFALHYQILQLRDKVNCLINQLNGK